MIKFLNKKNFSYKHDTSRVTLHETQYEIHKLHNLILQLSFKLKFISDSKISTKITVNIR